MNAVAVRLRRCDVHGRTRRKRCGFEMELVKVRDHRLPIARGIGAIKGDKWSDEEFNTDIDRFPYGLRMNARIDDAGHMGRYERYVPMRETLQWGWKTNGNPSDSYERFYGPLAERLLDQQS